MDVTVAENGYQYHIFMLLIGKYASECDFCMILWPLFQISSNISLLNEYKCIKRYLKIIIMLLMALSGYTIPNLFKMQIEWCDNIILLWPI